MRTSKIDIKSIIKESKEINRQLKEGVSNAALSKTDKAELVADLEDIVALVEQIKADIPKQKKAS